MGKGKGETGKGKGEGSRETGMKCGVWLCWVESKCVVECRSQEHFCICLKW